MLGARDSAARRDQNLRISEFASMLSNSMVCIDEFFSNRSGS